MDRTPKAEIGGAVMLHRFSSSISADVDAVTGPPQFAAERVTPITGGHVLEREVQRELLSQPHLRFSGKGRRRLEDGVSL